MRSARKKIITLILKDRPYLFLLGKGLILASLVLLILPSRIFALPEGENVVAGSATFDCSNPDTLNINTPSDKLIVDYNSFSIAQTETVNFNQPSSNAIALNRVVGVDPSSIMGKLTANGNIFLINPNGVIFGKDSRVDVAGLVASTLNISNEDFLKGNYNFYKVNGKSNSWIINQGNIKISNGGYIFLLSAAIDNQCKIQADLGKIVLASGEKMTLNLDDTGDISVVIDEAVKEAVLDPDGKRMDSAIKNSGTLSANGGKVLLTAKVLNNVFDYAINNSGVIEAKSIVNHNGKVELVAEGAPILNTGTINANTVIINIINSDFINKGKIISDTAPATIFIKALNIINSGIISVPTSITLEAENAIIQLNPSAVDQNSSNNPAPQAIIQSNQLNLKARQFGTSDVPLYIIGNNIYISRSQGDIEILDSLGIGTTILLRGPPDGFGAIVYNKDTNLTLQAKSGGITTASNATILSNNLSLIASQDINLAGTIQTATLNLLANGDISSLGSLKAQTLIERGASFKVGGIFEVSQSSIQNDDNAITYDSDTTVSGTINDNTDIVLNNDVIITLSGNTIFHADNDTNGSGKINMKNGSSIVGGGYDLTLYASDNSTLRSITGVGTLTIYESQSSSNPTYTTNNNISATNFTLNSATFDLSGNTLTISGNFTKSGGTFTTSGTVTFNATSTGKTITSGTATFNDATFNGSGGGWTLQDAISIDGNLTLTNGTVNTNGKTVTVSGNFSEDGGTFTGTAADMTVTGTFTQSGGTFTAPSDTLSISNTFNRTGGTFTHNSGTVKFLANNTYDITTNGATFNNLIFDRTSGGVKTLTLKDNFSIAGNLTVQNTATSNDYSVKGSGTAGLPVVTVSGNLSFPSTGQNKDVTFGSSASANNFTVNLAGDFSIADSDITVYSNIKFNSAAVNQNITQSAGTISGGTWEIDKGSTQVILQSAFNLGGNLTLTAGTYNANGQTTTITGLTTVSGGTYQASTATQTFNAGLTVSAGTFSGSTGAADVNGDVTISGTGTLTAPTGTFTVSGNWAKTGSTFNPGTGTVTFDGTSAGKSITSAGASFNNITFNGVGGAWILQDDLDINGNLTLTNGTLNLNGKTITLAGNFANNATFNHNSGTVTFDGAGTSTISGSTTFFNFASTTAGKQLTFTAGTTQTIAGTLTLTGTSGNLIVLRSSSTGNQWSINPQSTRSVSYVDVKDSNNTNATSITATNSTNSGNNTNWTLSGPAAYLKITAASSILTAGNSLELTITAYDANGNIAAGYTGTKSLTFSGLANAPNGTAPQAEGINIGTATNVNFTNGISDAGVATLIAYKAESATVDVTDGAVNSTGGNGLALTVSHGAANDLNFVQQPTNTLVNTTITPSVTVEVRDAWNNILTDSNTTNITISIDSNPGAGSLSGTLSQTTSNGVATFNDVSINKAGTNYTLKTSSGALSSAASNSFDVAFGAVILESQSSNSLVLRILLPGSQQLVQYRINTFDPIGSVYFYHPLVETDMSSFDQFILETGAYEFIDGAINLSGHDAILNLFKQLKNLR
jgi:filamentous hemagglutinin family protein